MNSSFTSGSSIFFNSVNVSPTLTFAGDSVYSILSDIICDMGRIWDSEGVVSALHTPYYDQHNSNNAI